MKFKTVVVIFENPKYNYKTSINPNCSDESIINYFKNTWFNMGVVSDDMQQCIDCKIEN